LSIEQSPNLFDADQLNAKLPPGMNRFALYAFGDTEEADDIWSEDRLDAEATVRSIQIDEGTRINGCYYSPEKVWIYHNGAYWKQSELEGKSLRAWKKQLTSGYYVCLFHENTGMLSLNLVPRTDTETWTIGGKTLSLSIAADLPIQFGKRHYSFDQIRLFENKSLSHLSDYWEFKRTLDLASTNNRHIGQLVAMKQENETEGWDHFLVLVPESQKSSFADWRENPS